MNQPTQPLQLNVDLKNTEKVEFDGQVLVGEGFVLRKVSKTPPVIVRTANSSENLKLAFPNCAPSSASG